MDSSADWDELIEMVEKLRGIASSEFARGHKIGLLEGQMEVLKEWGKSDGVDYSDEESD